MNANEYMQATERNLVHTYNRFPVTLDRGEGVYLYDTEGKKYLDFAAGIAVSGLGYGNRELNTVLKEQIDKLMHSSNLYYNTACGKAAAALKRITRMDRPSSPAGPRRLRLQFPPFPWRTTTGPQAGRPTTAPWRLDSGSILCRSGNGRRSPPRRDGRRCI